MQQLIETSEFYETIDLIITPIILANNETVCQYVNKAFLSQIGYNAQDIFDQETYGSTKSSSRRRLQARSKGELETTTGKKPKTKENNTCI